MVNDTFNDVEQHVLLSNNVKMPLLGLGTSHNGGYSHEAVIYALRNCGYRHIDTAKRYGCEKLISQAIKESNVDRADLFLASKCWPTDYGIDKTRSAASGSCQRLETQYLDLYMLHWPEVPSGFNKKKLLLETWRSLELLYDEGILRSIGVSNYLEEDLEDLLEECSVVPHVNQVEFHPFNNPKNLRQLCDENHIQFEGFSPLAKGRILNHPYILHLSRLIGKSPAQILVRWSIQNKVPTIPKSTNTRRVLENSQIFDFTLSDEEMTTLSSMPNCLSIMDRQQVRSVIRNSVLVDDTAKYEACSSSTSNDKAASSGTSATNK